MLRDYWELIDQGTPEPSTKEQRACFNDYRDGVTGEIGMYDAAAQAVANQDVLVSVAKTLVERAVIGSNSLIPTRP